MAEPSSEGLYEVFFSLHDPRQSGKVQHGLAETLVIIVCGLLVGADTLVEIELWAKEKQDWLHQHLRLPHGIPSHDTMGRLLSQMDPREFAAAFQRWVRGQFPQLADVVAIDGKTSRRSRGKDQPPLHLVSAFAAQASLVLGQQATSEKSNEKTAIPELLQTLSLKGCIVTLDAMGTHAAIAEQIQAREADYVLAVKDNQPLLAEAIREFFETFETDPQSTPHSVHETIEKDHGRLETRRCYAFSQLECLVKPEQWPNLRSFAVVESTREIAEKVTTSRRLYISSLEANAEPLLQAIRSHWSVENRLHWCLDVAFADDQMRLREGYAANNLAALKHVALNLIRQGTTSRKASIKSKRLLAATSDRYRAQLIGAET